MALFSVFFRKTSSTKKINNLFCKKCLFKRLFLLVCFFIFLSNVYSQQTYRKIENKPDNKRSFVFTYEIYGITPTKIARFQQRIPPDFKIDKSKMNDFHIIETNDMITFIWQALPADTVLRFSFEIIAPNDVQGTFHMGESAFMTLDKTNKLVKISFKSCPVLVNDAPYAFSHKSMNVLNGEVPCSEDSVPPVILVTNSSAEIIEEVSIANTENIVLDYYYRIQVSASKSPQNISDFEIYLMGNDKVFVEQHQGYFKYTIGPFKSFAEGQEMVKQYKNQKKLQGFLVGYYKNERVEVSKMHDYGKKTSP